MINLGRCIALLLSRHDRVPVLGLGTFIAVEEPSSYDEVALVYRLGSRDIQFIADSGAGQDDQILIDFIAAQKQVDHSAAQSLYRKGITALLNDLEHAGQATLDGLGTLFLNGNEILFEALKTPDITEAEVPVEALRKTVVEEQRSEPDQEMEPEALEPVEFVYEDEVREEIHKGGRSGWKTLLIVVLILAVIGGGAYVLRPDLFEALNTTQSLSDAPPNAVVPNHESDPLILDNNEEEQLLLVDSLTVIEDEDGIEELSQNTGAITPTVSYEIVVGSFATMEQANKFVEQLKKKGITVRAIDSRMPRNRKKVSYGSYTTEAEAYQALPEVQKTIEPTAWVAKVER